MIRGVKHVTKKPTGAFLFSLSVITLLHSQTAQSKLQPFSIIGSDGPLFPQTSGSIGRSSSNGIPSTRPPLPFQKKLSSSHSSNSDVLLKTTGGGALKNSAERVPAAIAMLVLLTLLIRQCGEKGVVSLVILLQIGMFNESTNVAGVAKAQKWLWFVTAQIGISLRALVRAGYVTWEGVANGALLNVGVYGLGCVGLIAAVCTMERRAVEGSQGIRPFLGEIAASVLSILFTVGLSSFWILTCKEYGIQLVLFPFILVAINDTMAYVFGCLVGKTPILPHLSPKKTWEGFTGAGLSTMVAAVPLLKYMLTFSKDGLVIRDSHALILGLFAAAVAPFGGFLASAVKRAHGAKDFGALIPGHGGIVDRLDCHLVMAPFVYLYLKAFL